MIRFKDFIKKEKRSTSAGLGLDAGKKRKRKDGNSVGGDNLVIPDGPIRDDQNLIVIGGVVGEE
jgi:hypothetical protein